MSHSDAGTKFLEWIAVALLMATAAGAASSWGDPLPPAQRPEPRSATQGAVDASRVAHADDEPGEWLLEGRDSGGSYYSPLDQIDASNVQRLGFAWDYALGTHRGLEATPLVVDGVMYTAGNFGRVYSLDAASGRLRWMYDPHVDGAWARYACCDAVNRGLAVWRGRVYVASLDGYLHSIDAATGRLLWRVDTLIGRAQHLPYTTPGAPLIAGGVVVIGNAGADFQGIRGYVSAYDLESGALTWRFFTVPRDPRLGPQDQPHLKRAIATWDRAYPWRYGGGGTIWDGMGYDPDLRLVYVGTGNASPYAMKQQARQGGDALYTASIIAIHAETGEMAWYYQVVPGDQWDYDSTQKFVLTELPQRGAPRKVLLQASKNGFLYVIDRKTGELISAHNFAHFNWARGLDPRTGRPILKPGTESFEPPRLVYPSMAGAHSWQPMSYDARTGLLYIPAQEAPMIYIDTRARPAGLIDGNFDVAGVFPSDYDPAALKSLFGPLPPLDELAREAGTATVRSVGVLKAWDPVQQKMAWERPLTTLWNGGVLSTGGGLVFQGDAAGYLNAYDARSGKRLAHIDIGTGIMAAPMSYRVGRTQYVAFMAGYGGATGLFSPYPPGTAAYERGNAGRVIALQLDGGVVPKPPRVLDASFPRPPPREASAAQIDQGAILYNRFCSRCHTFGRGELPDLRRVAAVPQVAFDKIVLGGALAAQGMGRFSDVLSMRGTADIRAFLLDQAWDAYTQQVRSEAQTHAQRSREH